MFALIKAMGTKEEPKQEMQTTEGQEAPKSTTQTSIHTQLTILGAEPLEEKVAKETEHVEIKPIAKIRSQFVGEQEAKNVGHVDFKPIAKLVTRTVGEQECESLGYIELRPVAKLETIAVYEEEGKPASYLLVKPVAQLVARLVGEAEARPKGYLEVFPTVQLEKAQTGILEAKPEGYLQIEPVAALETKKVGYIDSIHEEIKVIAEPKTLMQPVETEETKPVIPERKILVHSRKGEMCNLKEYAMKTWPIKFGASWNNYEIEQYHGSGWSIAVLKEEIKNPALGPNLKKTTIYAFAQKTGTEKIHEVIYGPCSSISWEENAALLFPQVNLWCQEISGNNPKLS